jgi:hypothetical protein
MTPHNHMCCSERTGKSPPASRRGSASGLSRLCSASLTESCSFRPRSCCLALILSLLVAFRLQSACLRCSSDLPATAATAARSQQAVLSCYGRGLDRWDLRWRTALGVCAEPSSAADVGRDLDHLCLEGVAAQVRRAVAGGYFPPVMPRPGIVEPTSQAFRTCSGPLLAPLPRAE